MAECARLGGLPTQSNVGQSFSLIRTFLGVCYYVDRYRESAVAVVAGNVMLRRTEASLGSDVAGF